MSMHMKAMPKQSHDFIAKFFNTSIKTLCTLAQALLVAMRQTTQLTSALDHTELQDIAIEALHLTANLLLYSTLLFSVVKAHGPRSWKICLKCSHTQTCCGHAL